MDIEVGEISTKLFGEVFDQTSFAVFDIFRSVAWGLDFV